MLFNSYEFLFLYLPVVLFGFYLFARLGTTYSLVFVLIASLVFYAKWSFEYTWLLIVSIAFNFCLGCLISSLVNKKISKPILLFGVLANLVLLGYYKYSNFFIDVLLSDGSDYKSEIILPLGISFYTFTQIAYLVDCYKKRTKEFRIINYALFVTWFPHLIAGPVLHHKEMLSQFENKENLKLNYDRVAVGLFYLAIGLFKKVVIADNVSPIANDLFGSLNSTYVFVQAWIGALAYAFQLYFDFSGYSDMAVGISLMFNISLPLNFNSPYKAKNISEFWKRWHISLSVFLRDYLYIPLGGNKAGKLRTYSNLMSTMILGGLWHGSGLNFILWGAIHGLYLLIHRAWVNFSNINLPKKTKQSSGMVSVIITFLCVVFAWVPFRSTSIEQTLSIWIGMLGINGFGDLKNLQNFKSIFILTIIAILVFVPKNSNQCAEFYRNVFSSYSKNKIASPRILVTAVCIGFMFGFSILSISKVSEFLYFQF